MSETASGDTSVMFVVGLIMGAFMGFLVAMFVTASTSDYRQPEYRKQMVELGVGYYDARTGAFNIKACTK